MTPKTRRRRPAVERARALAALLSPLNQIRILHYAAVEPLCAFEILSRLRRHDHKVTLASLNRMLARMAGRAWLDRKSGTAAPAGRSRCEYRLTLKGRQALNVAHEDLQHLVRCCGWSRTTQPRSSGGDVRLQLRGCGLSSTQPRSGIT